MFPWAAFPFLRYVLWLVLGILAGKYLPINEQLLTALFGMAVVFYGLLYIFRKHIRSFTFLQGLIAFLLLFTSGALRVEHRQAGLNLNVEPGETYWLAEAEQEAVPTAKTLKVPVRLLAYREGEEWKQVNSSLMLYIRKDSLQYIPSFGDRLLVRMEADKIPAPLNPNSFNYQQYMAVQGICCQAFVRPEQVLLLNHSSNGLRAWALEVRQWASVQMDLYLAGEQERGIANALVLGYRELLDDEINKAYAVAGAMHVLSVSGLHVGFIYFFLQLLFKPWRRNPWLKWLGFLFSLLVLWSYAFITGLSPSVLRSVIMFSMVLFALQLKRRSGIYNTLALAAFVMLLYNPFMLWSVGFQLSFLAVFGIVYLQPRFAGWYKGSNKVVRWCWNLLAVSLAAQLVTFPLGLYYFGQFPTYFFLTNLVVVPASGGVLGLGFLLLASSLIDSSLAAGAGLLLELLISLINRMVFMAEMLPYSSMETGLSLFQLGLLVLFLLLLLLFLHFRRFYQAGLAFMAGMVLLTTFVQEVYGHKSQRRLLLYNIPGHSALQLVAGRQEYLYSPVILPEQQLNYTLKPNRLAMGLGGAGAAEEPFQPAIDHGKGYDLLVWEGVSIAYVHTPLHLPCHPGAALEVDYVIISGNAVKDLELLSCYFSFKQLLIDGSNQKFIQNRLQQQAETLNLPYYLTSEEGAFELNL